MILEGFEIENWACIKKVCVAGLPATGVIVFCGPNRTGKSSIVQALRACLMDYSSTTTALKSCYPRGTSEKSVVTVTFRAGDVTYRVKKCFGTKESELASKTSAGAWKVETTAAADVHDRTCGYAGGNDSAKGLHQLLWLTQAEFELPDAKKFDANVQAQLRGILGVLQTPLDDRFIKRVKKRWNLWYSGQRKVGKQQQIKDSCTLAEKLNGLDLVRNELKESEEKFNDVEKLLRQATNLEAQKVDLHRQLDGRTAELHNCKAARESSQTRVAARQLAELHHASAVKEHAAAMEEQQQRTDAAKVSLDDEEACQPAQIQVEEAGQRVKRAEGQCAQQRKALENEHLKRRDLQKHADRVANRVTTLGLEGQVDGARNDCKRAEGIAAAIAAIEKYLADHPAPDEKGLEALKANRQDALRLTADLSAASINLGLTLEQGASPAHLTIDGASPRNLLFSESPMEQAVRRKAELVIEGWGRVEVGRGSDSTDLDEIEKELRNCDAEFANSVAALGISATDPRAMDLVLARVAENRLRNQELTQKKGDLKTLAPKGVAALHAKLVELQTRLADMSAAAPLEAELLPAEPGALEKLAKDIKQQLETAEKRVNDLENDISTLETNLNTEREKETTAKEGLAAARAKAKASKEQLDRLRSDAAIQERVANADQALADAQNELKITALTVEESTINERLAAEQVAVDALKTQIEENTGKYDVIKGRLIESEGLHARRSSLAARVDELTRLVKRESVEKDAVDRLYAVFEECREKQVGRVMGPIHDRVLNWMRVLDIDYAEMRFSDAFLPDKLLSRDGTAEFTLGEESTGAQEQIGMLVRLALGSLLTSAAEPAVAILDDPLTHCDVGRLNKMRVILRRAAEGDPNQTPPTGPLQILIFTCHPEWFRDDRATVIDLESPEVMRRWPV
jgi:predicted  nucleic acid-binding Zn-ribbon protein